MKKVIHNTLIVVSMILLISCGNNRKIENKTAQFDYFKYEGKDSWFDKEINRKTQYFNPIIAGYYPDPSFCRKGNTYYLVNSSFGFFPGIPIFTSKDLVNWKQIGHVLDRPSQLNIDKQHVSLGGIYAPAISYNSYNDTFYIITTDVNGIGNFYVTSKDPAKGWSDPILLPEVKNFDPAFFFDDDGKAYIVHNDEPENGADWKQQHSIRIHEFDVATGKTIGKNKEIVRGGVHPEDHPIWIEGPHLYKINGFYYLMCAEGGTAQDHSEVIFRSKSPWGPYEAAKYNPILTQRDLPNNRENMVSCTGHADLLQTAEGDWWAVFLATRPYDGDYMFNTGRETFMLPVKWENGFPIILEKGKSVDVVVDKKNLKPGSKYLSGNFVYNQEFNDVALDHSWIFIRTPKEKFYSVKGGKLKIEPLAVSIEEAKSPAAVLRRQQHTNFVVETQLDYTPKSENDFAGLTLFQNEKYQFLFGKGVVDGKESLLLYRMAGNKELLASIPLEVKEKPLKLKVEGLGRNCSFLYSFDGKIWKTVSENVDASNLSTQVAGGFIGTCIGLYGTSKHLTE